MIPKTKEVCDAFQKDLDNLERKCSVCQSKIAGNNFIMDFDPLKSRGSNLGLICNSCFDIENSMLRKITGDITVGEICRFEPFFRTEKQMKIAEARRQVRSELRDLKRIGG